MKIGFIFPGQGAQNVGMGKDIYEKYEEARNIYEKVKKITGIDIAKITFEGNENILNETKNTQIAILTMSLAILEILKQKNINAKVVAGLSLGEYSALIYSGAISFEDGVKLVQKRGEFMQNLAPKGEWAMAAILGMEEEKVNQICNEITSGFISPVNYNCVGQIAISGEKQAVEEASIKAKKTGAKRVIELKTTGPFHTEKLKDASDALRKELENVKINKFNIEVVKNIDGLTYTKKDNVKDILAEHIVSPVKFAKSLETMINKDIDTFIEIGPGKVLSGFVKRINTDKELNIFNINNVETLENTILYLKENIK